MPLEYLIVTQQACQTGQCSKQATPVPAVVVVEPPKTSQVIFLPVERPNYRPLFQTPLLRKATAPVVIICQDGKCK